jgi:hypothetical protein
MALLIGIDQAGNAATNSGDQPLQLLGGPAPFSPSATQTLFVFVLHTFRIRQQGTYILPHGSIQHVGAALLVGTDPLAAKAIGVAAHNLLLDDLDKELERRGHCFCRYADDCNIYVRSQAAGERVLSSVTAFLEGELRLRVNREKSAVAQVEERKFLGHRLWKDGELGVAPKSVERVKERIRQITRRNRGIEIGEMVERRKRKKAKVERKRRQSAALQSYCRPAANVSGSSALAMTTTPCSVMVKPRRRSCSRS